ncbi:hypothetical protein F5Y16DRAFT_9647 [Xylariaceae sp. FL0255]|nr:hypothetical protein F5Y16DRAFT_9647 [Xylariaceae sp. FL0255]
MTGSVAVTSSSGMEVATTSSGTRVQLNPAEEMLLMVLCLRVRDAASPKPIGGEMYAQKVINNVKVDLSRSLFTPDEKYIRYIADRARKIDLWCQEFLDKYADEPFTVWHLGCGLDSRES